MTETPENAPNAELNDTEVLELLRSLRRKEGSWVKWGQASAQLQKAGYSPQQIFEETGIEPVQQNQIVVAAQVYQSLVNGKVSEATLNYYQQKGSDRLYEFRILTQAERATAAEYVVQQGLDADEAREVAKAMKEISRLRTLPQGFARTPGDAVAYLCWKNARQQSDLQERSRLIAKGLRFAQTPETRASIEQLLTDFTVTPKRPAPIFPVYRLESSDEMPRIIPLVGQFPLSVADLKAVPLVEEEGLFKMVKFSGEGAWVPIPGWQMIRRAEDPVAILGESDKLSYPLPGDPEPVLAIVDRAQRQWDESSYFIVEQEGQIEIQWFETECDRPLLGKLILVMRPKRVFDEGATADLWQIEE
ncbi:MAG: hypothetical protein F6K32_20370 [Desertifilum sp. SIO1I2]|nr:hypothetical protein [Desertifilum sp. SIO1I2]